MNNLTMLLIFILMSCVFSLSQAQAATRLVYHTPTSVIDQHGDIYQTGHLDEGWTADN